MVDQVCGAFRHAAATTARTEGATLAREGDEPVQATVAAVKPREPACQESALEELPKGALDELRQAVAVAQTGRLHQEGLGAMAGTVDLPGRVSTGIEVSGDVLRFNPELPPDMERLDMRIRYRGHSLDLRLTRDTLTVRGRDRGPGPIRLGFKDEVFPVAARRALNELPDDLWTKIKIEFYSDGGCQPTRGRAA